MSLRQPAILVSALLVAGCQGLASLPMLPLLTPYRIDIQQGNVVTQDMVAKLQPGMTRGQVRFVLGTPLVTDIFHPNRWDYVYRNEKAGQLIEQRRIVVVFNEDKLLRVEGDVVPAAAAAVKPGAAPAPAKEEKPAAAPAEKK
jgi:outer membrane protein assembly factor BamE